MRYAGGRDASVRYGSGSAGERHCALALIGELSNRGCRRSRPAQSAGSGPREVRIRYRGLAADRRAA